MHMDVAIRRNRTLVGQRTAAGEGLKQQTEVLSEVVRRFGFKAGWLRPAAPSYARQNCAARAECWRKPQVSAVIPGCRFGGRAPIRLYEAVEPKRYSRCMNWVKGGEKWPCTCQSKRWIGA